jgi:lipid II:glycine glycyltransferase (peptidoglycan interpeptide bridge formation enzyme)
VIELYGASTSGGARGRANYLIKWEAMRSSRERGYRRYDMWGTDVEGLAEFKAGFGGEERRYMGAWELVTDARARRAVDVVQRARAGVRRPGRRATEGSAGPRSTAAPEGTAGLTVTSVLREAPADWDARAVDAAGGHVMQGTAWAAHRRAQGGDPRFVLFEDGGVALVVLRRSPLVPGAAATVRRGPAHRGEGGERLAERCAALAAWARAEGARHLFVDPELDHDPAYEAAMDRLGFAVTDEVQPSIHVMRLDLPAGATEESVLAGVSKSTRQRIRAAERAGVTVRADIAMERLDAFGGLLVDRAEDLGIAMRPELGYLAAWRRLIAAGHARLLVAEHEDRLLGGLLMFHQGGIHSTAYSADRADLRREFPGAMHLVRWTAIRDALSAGMHAIELGGVDLPGRREPPAKGDPNHGLFEHKASFGARWIVRTPARRRVLRPWAERYVDARGAALRAIRSLTRR